MLLKAKEKKERALGIKLFLKAERCSSPKCAMIRRPYRPGMHGKKRRRALSEYGQQLLEKQKIRLSYGLRETQLRQIFKKALQKTSGVGEAVIKVLEKRLDNVIYRLGLAPSRITARQYVSHGHFLVNGKKVAAPSFQVKVGDVVSIKPESKNLLIFKDLPTTIKKYNPPDWLEVDKEKLEGKVKSLPHTEDIAFDINSVVDYYSR
ncbi:MAG: 30S ribosomal protein S4 [Patescibacteria group bacterium]